MTNDEAARPDAGSEPAQPTPPPSDARPRPQYGEYAPPGWSWTPPGDTAGDESAAKGAKGADAGDASGDAKPRRTAALPTDEPAAGAGAGAVGESPAKPVPAWDRFISIALLGLGAIGAWNTALSMQQIPQQMQISYDTMGVGEFTPPEWLPTLALIGTIVQLALYAVVLGLTVMRIRARRIAFWIPLAGGVASFVIMVAMLAVVMLNDPVYLEWVTSGGTPTPSP